MNDPNELQYWPHGYPTADQQDAAEGWYVPGLLNGTIPQPKLNASDQLFVAGYVKTTPFTCWLGDGENTAGTLDYSLSVNLKTFSLQIATSDKSATGWLSVDTQDMAGRQVDVLLNGKQVGQFTGGGLYQYNNFGDGQTLTFTALPEPSTFVLAAMGLAGLLGYAWRKTFVGTPR